MNNENETDGEKEEKQTNGRIFGGTTGGESSRNHGEMRVQINESIFAFGLDETLRKKEHEELYNL